MRKRLLIALTMGDPGGIGPEIILKGFSKFKNKPYQVIVLGDFPFLQKEAGNLNLTMDFNPVDNISELDFSSDKLNVLNIKNILPNIPKGAADSRAGKASFEYIKQAVDMALHKKVEAITTAPINKKSISLSGLHFKGHTEMLAKLTNTQDYAMMLVGGKIRVVLVTTHLAISQVKKYIKRDNILKIISLTNRSLKLLGIKSPHIAVAGLNPHAGDDGVIGREDKEEILPAVEMARNNSIDVTGPFPADSLFVKAKEGYFDAVVVMYHDQGLIPVKMESFGKGVNVTLGLPLIRTSVDHGTAYDIVGKGIAKTGSLITALDMAAQMADSKWRNKKPLHYTP